MEGIAKACVGLAIVGFVLAVVAHFAHGLFVGAEGYSRASNNLALIALCLFVGFKDKSTT